MNHRRRIEHRAVSVETVALTTAVLPGDHAADIATHTATYMLKQVKLKSDKFFMGNPISELQGITCYMGSHKVT